MLTVGISSNTPDIFLDLQQRAIKAAATGQEFSIATLRLSGVELGHTLTETSRFFLSRVIDVPNSDGRMSSKSVLEFLGPAAAFGEHLGSVATGDLLIVGPNEWPRIGLRLKTCDFNRTGLVVDIPASSLEELTLLPTNEAAERFDIETFLQAYQPESATKPQPAIITTAPS